MYTRKEQIAAMRKHYEDTKLFLLTLTKPQLLTLVDVLKIEFVRRSQSKQGIAHDIVEYILSTKGASFLHYGKEHELVEEYKPRNYIEEFKNILKI